MKDTRSAFITIQGVDSKDVPSINSTVFTLKTDEGDFTFWKTKKDGGSTVAYSQYQENRYMAGDQVEVLYKEVDASYNHRVSGKKIEKVNKTIVKFLEDDGPEPAKQNTTHPSVPTMPAPPQSSQEILKDIALKVDLIFEILNNRPAVARDTIPVIHTDDDMDDANVELGEDEVNPDDLGF